MVGTTDREISSDSGLREPLIQEPDKGGSQEEFKPGRKPDRTRGQTTRPVRIQGRWWPDPICDAVSFPTMRRGCGSARWPAAPGPA